MPRDFWRSSAEAVVAAVDAAYATVDPVTTEYVSEFAQLPLDAARAALALAEDLGLLSKAAGKYSTASPLCRALSSAEQKRKATALRVVLEDYEPFIRFRERLIATGLANSAAQQTKKLLDISIHHEEVKETLLSLGQYSQAFIAEGGGVYRTQESTAENQLGALLEGCASDFAAELLIRQRVGTHGLERSSRENVIVPLADAVQRAAAGDGRGAVVSAGNATESFLSEYGFRVGVSLAGKNGINAKADELGSKGKLPKKLVNVSKYLGHIRNAADHGIDSEIGTAWSIRSSTGIEYCFVSCSFISAICEFEAGGAFEL